MHATSMTFAAALVRKERDHACESNISYYDLNRSTTSIAWSARPWASAHDADGLPAPA
jgi:hypothetical protein